MKNAVLAVCFFGIAQSVHAYAISTGQSPSVRVDTSSVHEVFNTESIRVSPEWCENATEGVVTLDGAHFASVTNDSEILWQPQSLGAHTMTCTIGTEVLTASFNVTGLAFDVMPEPNPPMPLDANIRITPLTQDVPTGGGGYTIVTSGSGTWTAAASEPWIKVKTVSGTVGGYVAYTVDMTTNVENRVGYVYVNGNVHTVKQMGWGGLIDSTGSEFECDGGEGSVKITPRNLTVDKKERNKLLWHARPNVDWLSVDPTSGVGDGEVTFFVAPYNEVSTRSGTLTIAGNEYTVFQYGRRIKLGSYKSRQNYETHVIPITVNALAITTWTVTPNNSWISIVDGGNGRGGDEVTIAIAENPSYRERTGTVSIGTETFTVIQEGRTDLSFELSPTETTASANGANGLVAVKATPDLPWTAKSQTNWLAVYGNYASGSGNGNLVYSASPNSTIYERRGTIVVTPDTASGLAPLVHTVIQPAPVVTLSSTGYTFEPDGESMSVDVTVASIVEWEVVNANPWIRVIGSTSHVGPATVTLQANANETVYQRSGTVTIAGKTFRVVQKARGVEVEYDTVLFDAQGQMAEGGIPSISVHPDGNSTWMVTASDPWIMILSPEGNTWTGDGEVEFLVARYVPEDATFPKPRTGTITIGDKTVYVTQRAYDLTIDPAGEIVTGNAGAGEIGVSAGIGDIWEAIATEPWITIVSGFDAGTGSGTVRFTFTDNDTGKTRSGKIVIAGEVYTLTQNARILVNIGAGAEGGGSVSGAGTYSLGDKVVLTAVPDDGYEFAYWTGDKETMQNPIEVTADVAHSYTAVFTPKKPVFGTPVCSTEGVKLTWGNLAWATEYKIYRAPTSEMPSSALATVVADGTCEYLDTTGEVGKNYWYWIEAIGATDTTECAEPATGAKQKPIVISPITYANLHGATHGNPSSYQEGTAVSFSVPSARTGYTFAGWTPAAITKTMTGPQTVTANWTANSYQIVYYGAGGSGTTEPTGCTYDQDGQIAANGFIRAGWVFMGWAAEENGAVVYQPGDKVKNLTATASGVVKLYAVWQQESVAMPMVFPPDGTVFKTASCTVSISCTTEGATIYYRAGAVPKASSKFAYLAPFEITDTSVIYTYAVKNGLTSPTNVVTLTKGQVLTFADAASAEGIETFTLGGDADWTAAEDANAKVGNASVRSGEIGDLQTSWFEATVEGAGTLTFWWKASCEEDELQEFDHLVFSVDGVEKGRLDGLTGWVQKSVTLSAGTHTLHWAYEKDESDAENDDCGWVDGIVWTPSAVPAVKPSIEGDSGATVTGDATNGFVVKPSSGKTAVEVTIPTGVAADKVTVEVSTNVATIKPHGAKVKIVKGGNDITEFLDIPAADASGAVNLALAAVKETIVKEALDVGKGAVIKLDATNPQLTTSPMRMGLTYTLCEGTTLQNMHNGVSTVGNGEPWTPAVSVKGGDSGFYTIKVTK